MNEEQGDQLINILKEISNKLNILIPKTAKEEKIFLFDSKFKNKMRSKLFNTLTEEQQKLFFKIETEIKEEINY